MKKTDALKLLGVATGSDAARMLGLTPQAFQQWPAVLDTSKVDRVVGCAYRHGLKLPKR